MSTALAIQPTEANGQPLLSEFVNEYGRLPRIGDDYDPWTYRGWLLPYLALCEQHPLVSPRYDYVTRTLEAGKLLDEPIPQIHFVSEHAPEAKEGMKMLETIVDIAERGSGYSRGIEAVCEWLGFAVGVSSEPSKIKRADQEQMYRTFDAGKWLVAPTDYIGQYMAERGVGKAAAFFPTPMSICTMMAMMNFDNEADNRAKTTMDCAVGTGRTLLAASNYSLRLYGQDINGLCVLACKINFAFFAPWHHIPESFFPKVTEPIEALGNPVPVGKSAPEGRIEQVSAIEPISKKYSTKIEQPMLFEM